MAHYAKIENKIVVDVIVADSDVIQHIPGHWIQTSYSTRGGIHYNMETGEPSVDQSKALRKNYAGIGSMYDSDLDAFIPPRPADNYHWNLDPEKLIWIKTIYPDSDGISI